MIRRFFRHVWAIALKELQLETRFIMPLLTQNFVNPLKFLIWFLVIYSGFFSIGASAPGNINRDNFITFLLIGGLVHIFFNIALIIFPTRYFYEKWWQTIQGIMVAPINSFKLTLGIGLAELIKALFGLLVIATIIVLIKPVGVVPFLFGLATLVMIFFGLMAIGLIRAATVLVNENLSTFFEYLILAVGFLSCFYYPIDSLPRALRFLAFYNPIYQAVETVRWAWFAGKIEIMPFLFTAAFVIVSLILGTLVYNLILKKYDIEGY